MYDTLSTTSPRPSSAGRSLLDDNNNDSAAGAVASPEPPSADTERKARMKSMLLNDDTPLSPAT